MTMLAKTGWLTETRVIHMVLVLSGSELWIGAFGYRIPDAERWREGLVLMDTSTGTAHTRAKSLSVRDRGQLSCSITIAAEPGLRSPISATMTRSPATSPLTISA